MLSIVYPFAFVLFAAIAHHKSDCDLWRSSGSEGLAAFNNNRLLLPANEYIASHGLSIYACFHLL